MTQNQAKQLTSGQRLSIKIVRGGYYQRHDYGRFLGLTKTGRVRVDTAHGARTYLAENIETY